jgi:diguanylate cyclase (GGDEF)-like protein
MSIAAGHILVVDDREDNRALLETILEDGGLTVSLATNGHQALHATLTVRPDTILLDVAMPGMDGFEVCRRLQEDPETAAIPVILLTAQALDKRSICKGLALGATDYITKPFDPDELLARVRKGLRVKRESDRLRHLALTDPLTGLHNRLAIMHRLKAWMSRWRRHDEPFGLLLIDVDHFKRVNDTCGHEGGDRVLQRLAEVFNELARTEDSTGRIGGEEFVILLDHARRKEAVQCAERLRAMAAELAIDHAGADPISVTLSIGVVSSDELGEGASETTVLRYADDALYVAKNGGRNRVIYYPDLPLARALEPAPGQPPSRPPGGGQPTVAGSP